MLFSSHLARTLGEYKIRNNMSDIKWKKKYEIGHRRIDFEHQIFVDLIAKIDDGAKMGKDKGYLERLLNELRAYAEFHFISEENIMYSVDYPDYEIHTQHHQKLLNEFGRELIEIEMGKKTIEEFLVFLKDWFVHHTLNEDKKIASFVKGKSL